MSEGWSPPAEGVDWTHDADPRLPGGSEYVEVECVNHRGHWDANGTGDWHCSEHRQPDCNCIVWLTD